MLKRYLNPALFLATLSLTGLMAFAQPAPGGGPGGFGGPGGGPPPANVDGPTDEERQQMQQIMQKVMQNMQAKGMDPMQFFQQMRSGGGFDPAEMQQKLLEQGLIDQQSLDVMTKIQDKNLTARLDRLQERLGATDEEWKELKVRILRVVKDMAELGQMTSFTGINVARTGEASKALKDLRTTTADATQTSPEIFVNKLAALRQAQDKARFELAAARKDLQELVTIRQEAILTSVGILE